MDDQLWEEEEESFDAALLMELLGEEQHQGEDEEKTAAAYDDDSRLRSVIRSLETEISSSGDDDEAVLLDPVHRHEDCEDCRMDGILAGVDSCSTSAAMAHVAGLEEPFGWVEMAAAEEDENEEPCGGDMADWYVDECIDELMAAGYGELRGHHCAASVDEHFFSLWDL